jgi:hypothetical protein
VLIASAILGAMDDRLSLLGGVRQGGMTARFKFLWLTLFALVAAALLHAPFPYGLGLRPDARGALPVGSSRAEGAPALAACYSTRRSAREALLNQSRSRA